MKEHKTFLTATELKRLLDAKAPVVVLDTRPPPSHAERHIPGAVNVPEALTHFVVSEGELKNTQARFAEIFSAAGLSGEELAVVHEETMDGGFGQSCRGYFILKYLGYPRVAILHGGFKSWVAAGLPVTSEPSAPTRQQFPLRIDDTHLVTARQVLQSLEAPSVVNLDVRDHDEWMGTVSAPAGVPQSPRSGRIPGAVWIHWKALLQTQDGVTHFRSPEEIREICQKVGITPESRVQIYCLGGVRASNTYLALQSAGFRDVGVYLGSWFEWSRNDSMPIETAEPRPERMYQRP
jgi:thiosulfate/3-mercaptopyruvate sulfurtransferase